MVSVSVTKWSRDFLPLGNKLTPHNADEASSVQTLIKSRQGLYDIVLASDTHTERTEYLVQAEKHDHERE